MHQNFYFDFLLFDYIEKRLDKKTKVNFKVYYVIDWTTNNHNARIIQNFKQIGHEIWSVNKI